MLEFLGILAEVLDPSELLYTTWVGPALIILAVVFGVLYTLIGGIGTAVIIAVIVVVSPILSLLIREEPFITLGLEPPNRD